MASYKASEEGIKKAKAALKFYPNKSKTHLAGVVDGVGGKEGVSRTTVNNFFAGKPVHYEIFHNICKALKLDWRSIADVEIEEIDAESTPEIDSLVQSIRQQVSNDILHRCGKMRILDMEQPIEYGDIYTSVNILEKSAGSTRSEMPDRNYLPDCCMGLSVCAFYRSGGCRF